MNRAILTTAIALLSVCANAQVKFGVFVQPQFSWLSPESRTVGADGSKTGIAGGLIADYYFAKNYALATGMEIGTQGGKLLFEEASVIKVYDETDSLPAGTKVDYNLQYLTIPLGLKLKSNQVGYYTFFANIGFTNQFNLNAKASSNNSEGLDDNSIKDEISVFNLGYHFGGGIEYALGEDTALTLSVVYHNGFWDITTSSTRVNSRVLSIKAGILF